MGARSWLSPAWLSTIKPDQARPIALNEDIAGRLDEVARLFAEQGANPFRVQAYHHAAEGALWEGRGYSTDVRPGGRAPD